MEHDHNQFKSSHLVLLLDTNIISWYNQFDGNTEDIHVLLNQLLLFCNLFQSMSEYHRLTIIGMGNSKHEATFLYKQNQSISILDQLSSIYDSLHTAFKFNNISTFNSLSKALIMAESYINRISVSNTVTNARILVIQASREDPKDYITTIQAVFHAQKQGIVIDSCRFSKNTSTCLLYSISEMTNGSCSYLNKANELLFPLLFTFIMDPNTRKHIDQPSITINPSTDGYISPACCSCHKKVIDIGHVCSVCFTGKYIYHVIHYLHACIVYCQFVPVCRHCRTKFDIDIPIKQR